MHKVMTEQEENIVLERYIVNNFERYFDLTEGRYLTLMGILNRFNAKSINLEEFRRVFELEGAGFFEIFEFLLNANNVSRICQYGKLCLADSDNKMVVESIGHTL